GFAGFWSLLVIRRRRHGAPILCPTRRSSDLDAHALPQGGARPRSRHLAHSRGGRDTAAVADRLLFRGPYRGAGIRQLGPAGGHGDRKSTRLNSSHVKTSYAAFCLKKNRTDTP